MKKRSIKEDPISVLDRNSTWMDGVRAYLLDGTLRDTYPEMVARIKRAGNFEIHKGELLKNNFLKPLLKSRKGGMRFWMINIKHQAYVAHI